MSQKKLDGIVVLGAGIDESKRRAEHAAEIGLLIDCPIIVSGGEVNYKFFGSYGKEVDFMSDELEKRGIEKERIISEGNSYSTLTNLVYSERIARKRNMKNIAIVTSKAHMPRTMRMAKKVFYGYDISPMPVRIRGLKDVYVEGLSVLWGLFSTTISLFNSHGLSYYVKSSSARKDAGKP